jgi:hypothetical protein
MVVGEMGMLDDAIREHLELKRRRGADPGEVDREQAEALAPVSDRQLSAEDVQEQDGPLDELLAPETGTPAIETLGADSREELPETAELDMERALRDDRESEQVAAVVPHDADEHGSFEWDAPDDFDAPSAAELPAKHHPARGDVDAPAEQTRPGSLNPQSDSPRRH